MPGADLLPAEIPPPDICFFHAGCPDGFGAAWAMRQGILSRYKYTSVYPDYVPFVHSRPITRDIIDKAIYYVDCAPPREILEKQLDLAKYVVILDHHATTERDLKGLTHSRLYLEIDQSESGATLTWKRMCGPTPPALLQHVRDRDLWKWEMPDSEPVLAYVDSFPRDMHHWDELHKEITQGGLGKVVLAGEHIQRYEEQYITVVCSQWFPTDIVPPGMPRLSDVPTINIPPVANSKAMNYLLDHSEELTGKRADVVAGFYINKTNQVWSLRSRRGGPDVARIAEALGGGGHPNASGFRRPIEWKALA